MKNIRTAVLAVCVVTIGSTAALAQYDDTAYGTGALSSNTSGNSDSAFGYEALYSNTSGLDNSAFGTDALWLNTTGGYNAAFGVDALSGNTTGSDNLAFGYEALLDNNGSYNTATGVYALNSNTTSDSNTAVGYEALTANTSGDQNTALGDYALYYNTTGSYNIDIGSSGTSSDDATIRIGTPGTQTSFYAAGVDGVSVSGGVAVYINSSGQLGTVNSSIRFKEDVHDMAAANDGLMRLRPVTYRYKQAYADGSRPIEYGLIAEEVAKVYPDLVVKGADGQIQTVQYQKLTPMLLNELQKQHQLLEQQQQTIAQQGEAIRELKEQQVETMQMLEKRLAALETAQTSGDLAARPAAE